MLVEAALSTWLACALFVCAHSLDPGALPQSPAIAFGLGSSNGIALNEDAVAATTFRAPAVRRRKHSLTMEPAFDPRPDVEKAFGWDNFRALAPYLDLVMTGPGDFNTRVRNAGLHTALYVDANLCSNRRGPGSNRYAKPDCSDWPASAFYTEDGHPERTLTVSYNGSILQRVGDPASSEWQARTLATLREATADNVFEVIEIDDATSPDELYMQACWGGQASADVLHGCSNAPGGIARPPWNARYSRAQWQAGERALADRAPRPLLFNGLAGYDHHESLPAIVQVVLDSPNAWGAMCDTCFYGVGGHPNPYLWTHPILDVRLNGMMRIIRAQKNVVVVNSNVLDPGQRARALAEIMLAYHPDRLWQWARSCGEISLIHACPEAALTFYEPYRGYPASVAGVADRSGNYVREFAECYDNGRPVGPCAAVVNPDLLMPHLGPRLRNTYRHTLVITGTSLCNCYGDSGSLSELGNPMPGIIPPTAGYVLFQ